MWIQTLLTYVSSGLPGCYAVALGRQMLRFRKIEYSETPVSERQFTYPVRFLAIFRSNPGKLRGNTLNYSNITSFSKAACNE